MASRLIIDGVQPANDSLKEMFKAPNTNGVRITAFTITNSTSTAAACEIYITGDKGRAVPSVANKILQTEELSQNETYCPHELINQIIPAGGALYLKVSTGDTLSFRASGGDA